MHKFHPSFLREYDARGVVGKSLSNPDAYYLGRAYATVVKREGGKTISVGRDGRHSSPQLEQELIKGIIDCGVNVIKLGVCPTPMAYFSVYELKTDGCIMVTGSHNPPEYNGFKMMIGERTIYGDKIQSLAKLATNSDFANGNGEITEQDVTDRYIDRLLKDLPENELNIGWDPSNGSSAEIVNKLTTKLGGKHFVINGQIDGDFPDHPADPTIEENLSSLRKLVKKEGLDLGLCFDGDGDRLGVIDRFGRILWGDQLLSIFAKKVLEDEPGANIITDVKASSTLFDAISDMGGNPVMWKTGHSLIKAKMKELNSPLAGEMSGHFYFKHDYYGFDDGIYSSLRLISAILEQGGDLAKIRDGLPDKPRTKEMRFDCCDQEKFQIIEDIKKRIDNNDIASISTIDGIRVTNDNGWWLLRASNTQPVLVAMCEGKNKEDLSQLLQEMNSQLELSNIHQQLHE